MSNQIDKLLDEVVSDMMTIFNDNLYSIILFGSYARGDFDVESDLDIMVVVDVPVSEISQYRNLVNKTASRLSLKSDKCITVCILLQDLANFTRYRDYHTFLNNIVTEGITLYAA